MLGHERPDLLSRFGRLPRPWLFVPPPGATLPPWRERTGALLLAPTRDALAARSRLWRAWAWAVAASCVLVGAHSLADVAGGLAVVALLRNGAAAWELARRGAERVANSWRDWRVGPLRVINHGAWAGLGAASGVVVMGSVLGAGAAPFLALFVALAVLGAGAWAQAIEGRGLSRPFGFYGGLLGGVAAVLAAPAFGIDRWTALAAGSLAAPVVQPLGRLRCLVQGCCHGAPAPAWLGIRHVTPLSRVVKAGLGGVPVHPTALYSILWNALVLGLLVRLATLHADANLLAGVYFLLSGAGRFVEEAYRGEPQTPMVLGLRLYQWLAVASVAAGAALTALGPSPAVSLSAPDGAALAVAAGAFLVCTAAMGVDLPGSARRLSRLA